ncbi:MAG: hypothetical protein NTV19_01705, partial [Burkholderiales bacterium]|nr:hypothetical protein [Burkholderiales bacterium]
DGNVTVSAVGTTRQVADATAIAVGLVGVGSANSLAKGQVATLAQVGSGITTAAIRTGDLIVTAAGDTKNTAKSTGGSGGAIAGNASVAKTSDISTAAATILGGTIYAGTIQVTSDQLTDYLLNAFSMNVALAGASGAFGSNTSTTSATTTIGKGTALSASDSGEAVRFASRNRFRQIQTDYSAQGGAGGAISGSASLTTSTIIGTSAVTVGDSAAITTTNPLGSMTIVASHDLNTTDKVTMESGGLLTGAGVSSSLEATPTNTVSLGKATKLTSAGDIHVGSWTSANASTTSYVNTWGLASVGAAYAYVTIISVQTVTIDDNSVILAFGNVNLTAGRDKSTNNQTSIQGNSLATGYIRGLVAIPVADGASDLTSTAALNIRPGVTIRTGANVEIAANPGSATPTSS